MRKSRIALGITAALSAHALLSSSDVTAAGKADRQTASGPVPNSRAQFKYPNNVSPAGSTVLYDQSGTAENGAPAQFSSSTFDSDGADDFVVTDATGWNVSAFNFQISFSAAPLPATVYDIDIYPDAAGLPGATATCSYADLPGVLDGSNTALSVALPSACALPAGTYWVAFRADADFPPQAFWSNASGSALGAIAAWQNPGDGFTTGCTSWTAVSSCGAPPVGGGNPNFLFQVVGAVNGGGGGCAAGAFCLDVTLGTDTTAGACGTVDTLDVTVGDQVNYCYTITNNTGISLDFHTLSDNIDGTLFSLMNASVADGSTYQYNRVDTAGATETRTSNWTAQDLPPGYSAELVPGGGGITDRIFCDGFDGVACDPGSGSFIDISTTGTALGLADDGATGVTMPFSFTLYGTTSNELTVANNGGILFGTAGGSLAFGNEQLPAAGLGHAILPLWDDFDAESGDVYWEAQGTAPNRKFIVEWFNRVHYDGASNTDGATFEVIFDEATQSLSFQYLDVSYSAIDNFGGADPDDCTNGVCATIGLQDSDTLANQFSFMAASITDNSAIEWTATVPQVFSDDDTTTLNVGAPDIDVTPTSVSGTVAEGGTADLPLTIANLGDRDLVWTAEEAPPADSHFPPPGSRFAMPMGDPALASAGPAPRSRQNKPGQSNGVHAPLGGTVPAFSADVYNDALVSFDFGTPGTVNPVAANVYKLVGGAFIDGDLSTMWSIDGFNTSANFNDLVTVDVASGAVTEVVSAPNSLGEGWTSLDYDATTGNLYGSSVTCGTASHLWTIDRVTGATNQVGEITGAACIIGIAVDPTGLMYGLDIVTDSLFAIDKTTGNASLIGSIGFNAGFAQDMTFDQATGILYLTGFDQDANAANAYTVDLATGAATLIGPFGTGALVEFDAVAIQTAGGPCSQPADQPWLTITPASGTTAAGGSTPVSLGIDPGAAVEGDALSGTVCVTSNDPDEHTVEVPVEVTVGPPGGGGDVVDSGVVDILVPADGTGIYVNWLTGETCVTGCADDGFDFNPYGTTNLTFFWSGDVAPSSDCVMNGTSCATLAAGTEIGAASTFGDGNATLFRAGGVLYMGFRFTNAVTTQVNYGYAQLTTTGATGHPATINRYWYNSVGDSITIP